MRIQEETIVSKVILLPCEVIWHAILKRLLGTVKIKANIAETLCPVPPVFFAEHAILAKANLP